MSLYIKLIIIILLLNSCKGSHKTIPKYTTTNPSTECPANGTCTFEVLKDKTLALKHDGIGSLYPEITEGNKTILKFQYHRNQIPNTVDGSYTEEIFLEINPENPEVSFKDKELLNCKLLFGRHCFCKGQAGYYRISEGEITIQKINKKEYFVNLTFKTEEVPQVINQIQEVFVLK